MRFLQKRWKDITCVHSFIGQPVAGRRAASVISEAASALCGKEAHVFGHGCIVVFQDAFVSVHLEYCPWNDDAGVAPCCGSVAPEVAIRCYVGIGAVVALAVAHVAHPFVVEDRQSVV